ncbi:hypothetical protein D3C87_1953950 [compost metagenome]
MKTKARLSGTHGFCPKLSWKAQSMHGMSPAPTPTNAMPACKRIWLPRGAARNPQVIATTMLPRPISIQELAAKAKA